MRWKKLKKINKNLLTNHITNTIMLNFSGKVANFILCHFKHFFFFFMVYLHFVRVGISILLQYLGIKKERKKTTEKIIWLKISSNFISVLWKNYQTQIIIIMGKEVEIRLRQNLITYHPLYVFLKINFKNVYVIFLLLYLIVFPFLTVRKQCILSLLNFYAEKTSCIAIKDLE